MAYSAQAFAQNRKKANTLDLLNRTLLWKIFKSFHKGKFRHVIMRILNINALISVFIHFCRKSFQKKPKIYKYYCKFVIGYLLKLNIFRIKEFSSWISVEFVSLTLVLVLVWFGCRVAVANDWPAECKKRRACIKSPCIKMLKI